MVFGKLANDLFLFGPVEKMRLFLEFTNAYGARVVRDSFDLNDILNDIEYENGKAGCMQGFSSYRDFLFTELKKRQNKNSAYSLRAFARDLEMTSSRLSEVLNGKVGLSQEKAALLAEKINLSEEEALLFIDLVLVEHARSHIERHSAVKRVRARMLQQKVMPEENFSLISDWHNLAILELVTLPDIQHSIESFARHLGMEEEALKTSIERLERLGYLRYREGKWYPEDPDTTTSRDVPSEAIQNFQKSLMKKAISTLETVSVEDRDYSSIIFAMNKQQMTIAKERIKSFRRSLIKELEQLEGKDEVYCLSLQFFPVTEK